MQMFSGAMLSIRPVEHVGPALQKAKVVRDPELLAVATRAVDELPSGQLRATGAVADALAAGRLVGSRDAAQLDALERLLGTGTPDPASRLYVGNGMNHARYVTTLHGADGSSVMAVDKPGFAQGAQEHFGWKVARAMGIDHRVAAVGRSADGAAQVEFASGSSMTSGGVINGRTLQIANAQSHLGAGVPLSPAEAAQAGRIEAQLMATFDYIIANSDRNGGNGIIDARSGVKFIDQGHVGRGQQDRDDVLIPGLRGELYGAVDKTVTIDPVVVDFLKRRLDEPMLRSLHHDAFNGEWPLSTAGEFGRYNRFAASRDFEDGAVARLHHVLDTGAFTYGGSGEKMGAPLLAVDNVGHGNMRGGIAAARFGGGGGFGMM